MAEHQEPTIKKRDQWSGRGAFVLAAIGSAVGLGNLWGFPYKLYEYGGGAFLIPYFIAMLVMGIPLLIMEFSLGHWAQNSPPGAFGKVLKRYRFVGWWLVILAFVIITYYSIILAYCIDYTVVSLRGLITGTPLPWAGTEQEAGTHFSRSVQGNTEGGDQPMWVLSWKVVLFNLLAWLGIYFSLFKGVKWVSKVVLLTVPLPWLMLVVLAVRGMTLDGAVSGLEYYLEPQWAKLLEADTWRWAFGQVFFSMSLGFAVMLSYASFLHRSSDLNNNALIIGIGDLTTSFVAGIAVFATLGGMSMAAQVPVEEVVNAGPGLAFVAFPYALAQLPWAALFASIFFIALLTLGIDSAFSIVEATLASIDDNTDWPRRWILPGICAVGFTIGLTYTGRDTGLGWVGWTDGLVNGPLGILLVALAETLVVGWAWGGRFTRFARDHANERSDWKLYGWWDVIIKYVAPALLITLIVWSISDQVHGEVAAYQAAAAADEPYTLPWSQIIGALIFIAVPLVTWAVLRLRNGGPQTSEAGAEAKGGIPVLRLIGFTALVAIVVEILQSQGLLAGTDIPHEPDGQLGASAYIILAVAFLVIFGGLAWCFWRAMLAAGGQDTEIQDEPSI